MRKQPCAGGVGERAHALPHCSLPQALACEARKQQAAARIVHAQGAAETPACLAVVTLAASVLLAGSAACDAALAQSSLAALEQSEEYIEDIPSSLSSGDVAVQRSSMSSAMRGANAKPIAACAAKCITTCTRGCVPAAARRDGFLTLPCAAPITADLARPGLARSRSGAK